MATLQIQPERCVHQILALADCRECVKACPTGAWSTHEDGLGFDEDRCDRCGLCVAACPMEALSLAAILPQVFTTEAGTKALAVACEKMPEPAPGSSPWSARATGQEAAPRITETGIAPCIDALSPGWILRWASHFGASVVSYTRGDCQQCPRAGRASLEARWAEVEKRLRWNDFPSPALEAMPAVRWQTLRARQDQPSRTRRRLFARVLSGTGPDQPGQSPALQALSSDRRFIVNQLMSASQASPSRTLSPALWEVALDAPACTSCQACAQLCEAGAITWQDEGAEVGLVFRMTLCTGCTLCVAVCEQGALSLQYPATFRRSDAAGEPSASEQGRVLHRRHRLICSRCQQSFWTGEKQVTANLDSAGRKGESLCPVCKRGRPAQPNRMVQT